MGKLWLVGFGTVLILLVFTQCGCAQSITYRPTGNDPESIRKVPALYVDAFNNKNEELFNVKDSPRPRRKYVFGGYIMRDWQKVMLSAYTSVDQYPIYLQHRKCGAGQYSVQFRLDNPPRLDNTELNAPRNAHNGTAFFSFRSGLYLAATPCCPYVNKWMKCCSELYTKSQDSNTGIGIVDYAVSNAKTGLAKGANFIKNAGQKAYYCRQQQTFTNPSKTYVQPICDIHGVARRIGEHNMGEGRETSTSRCLMLLNTDIAVNNGDTSYQKDYLNPDSNDLFTNGRYRVPLGVGSTGTCASTCHAFKLKGTWLPGKMSKPNVMYTIKKFCTEDNKRMRAYWGPKDDGVYKGGNTYYQTHDMWWNKASQCQSCTRFGMMYYSGINFNSVCTKVGPGEAANADGTGVIPSPSTRNKYVPLANPKRNNMAMCKDGTEACTSHYTYDYRLIIDMTTAANNDMNGVLQVRGTRILKSDKQKKEFTTNMDIGPNTGKGSINGDPRCRFDAYSNVLPYSEIRTASSCIVPAIIPITWPKTCTNQGGTDQCSVIASMTSFRRGNSVSTKVAAGSGDTRLFAHVTLGTQVTDGRENEKQEVLYYKDNTYSKLWWAEGMDLTYELAVVVRKSSKRGCGRDKGGTMDIDSTKNYFTYYYPHQGNYLLENAPASAFVDSYQKMVTEQREAMTALRNLEDPSQTMDAKPMPVRGTREKGGDTVALLSRSRLHTEPGYL